ncbi:MAG TPA: ribonuclease E/G [Marinilabiliales bacterium]|nr:MAG: ribonuclease G [Bacteroidetes bacterium GWC2_40_13]OFX74223.1 MAG: ribonuclease G [Bacteroidetes bacterium GWD2_40_43]OFX93274.1 MAG: ribonuclease G [Bacteroidetes bacterium GWE2_40_63]OFY21610.1 MAG: ribonuclease G [Bacteroidetes bacterium GWF2_40_13]OFZ25143.1 MAG: ribonuclease G [Bacteroidetes bacterium RIFOXYC2_FULL_40_12]HAM98168.1 ribonuclease E/G [Marinilabiliales bacterium]
MSKELVINSSSSEVVIALLEDKNLVELNKEKNNTSFAVGDIYLGRVKKIMPGLNAAFIDVGYEKDAFLHYLDLGHQFRSLDKYLKQALDSRIKTVQVSKFQLEPDIDKNGKIQHVLTEGQSILVQVAKEPISTKGPRLASEISIAGRNLVLIPFTDKISISQKIQDSEERDRLRKLIQSIKPKNYGVIVRTVAESRRVADLDAELRELVQKWEGAFASLKNKPPRLVLGELNRTTAILRDMLNNQFNNVYINDKILFNETRDYIRAIAPEREKIIKLYNRSQPIFEYFGLEKQIKALFGKTVAIQKGAYLVIEHTEALHVIDVNSGNRSQSESNQEENAIDVNLVAAYEISRQLRLRDMGGIIVIDFIDMHDPENKQKLYDKMREFMSSDRAKHHILPLSKFGLMQITRQRVRPEMTIQTIERCPSCNGSGEVTPSILFVNELENHIRWTLQKYRYKKVVLKLHPYVAAYLTKGFFSICFRWRLKYLRRLTIRPSGSNAYLEYQFYDGKGDRIFI